MATGVEKAVIDDFPSFLYYPFVRHHSGARLSLLYSLVLAAELRRRRR
jgi:hypothetical protein